MRSRLTRYLGDLHGVSQEWGVSAYQTIQNLAQIAALPTHPTTHVRLNKQTAHSIADKIEIGLRNCSVRASLANTHYGERHRMV